MRLTVVIRDCAATDVDLLEARMPTGGTQAHAAHFARQQAGTGAYLVAWQDEVPVAWQDEVPVGVVLIRWDDTLPPELRAQCPDCVEIRNLGVGPKYQRQGIGAALVHAAEEYVRSRGHACVALGVGEDNPGAARLYAKLGYRNTEIREVSCYVYADDEGIDRQIVEHNRFLVKELVPQPKR